MSSDLIYNGTIWVGRTGLNTWGTFYTQVSPTYTNDGACLIIDKTWGSRMVEMSGRIRGIAGIATLNISATVNITFPGTSYFSFFPIIDSVFMADDSMKLDPDTFTMVHNHAIDKAYIRNYWINPKFYFLDYIDAWNGGASYLLRNIGTGGFGLYHLGLTGSIRIIMWRAFGV